MANKTTGGIGTNQHQIKGRSIAHAHTAAGASRAGALDDDVNDDIDDEDNGPCRRCGEPSGGGEGYDGFCGNCADRIQTKAEADHDDDWEAAVRAWENEDAQQAPTRTAAEIVNLVRYASPDEIMPIMMSVPEFAQAITAHWNSDANPSSFTLPGVDRPPFHLATRARVQIELSELVLMRDEFNAGRVTPRKIIGVGYKNPRKIAADYLNRNIEILTTQAAQPYPTDGVSTGNLRYAVLKADEATRS